MSKFRKVFSVGGTLACALGIGFFMQREDAAPPPAIAPTATPAVVESTPAPAKPSITEELVLQDIVLTSAQPDVPKSVTMHRVQLTEPSSHDASSSLDNLVLPTEPKQLSVPKLACAVTARADVAPSANVQLTIDAPCLPNERVTVHHSGMMLTVVTDADGRVQLTVPALSDRSIFIADFGNGKGAVVTALVPDLADYDRVVLQWSGDAGFQLHAREFGAGYGDRGHVWAGNTTTGPGSSVIRLGTSDTLAPKMAEVYTFPSGASSKAGTVALSIETEVKLTNCGRDITAQTLELRNGASLRTQDVTLSMPNCGAVGDFLVLNNLVDDLTIAAK